MNEATKQIEDFLIRFAGQYKEDDHEIDQIHDMICLLIQKERYKTIDLLLKIINPKKISIDVLLSILICTSWCKEHLKQREKFFRRASWRLDCMFSKGMLEGLE